MNLHSFIKNCCKLSAKRCFAITFIMMIAFCNAFGQTALEKGFANPPLAARTRAYWWWLNGNVTKEALTKDLEWMKKIGMGGSLIFDAGEPAGPVPVGPMFGSPEWRDLFKHAIKEADRLGLELTLSAQSGWNLGGPTVTADEASKHITWSETSITGPLKYKKALEIPKSRDHYYRDSYLLAYKLKDTTKTNRPAITKLESKLLFKELGWSGGDGSQLLQDTIAVPGEEDVLAKDVIDISDKLSADGILNWDVPDGFWKVVRFGYTNSGGKVSTSSGNWKGYVVDYLDSTALKTYWDKVIEPLIDDVGPLAGKSFKGFETDSWEGGGVNWTLKFPEEFRKRRGYDIRPFLLVVSGKIVDSREVSNRFLNDFRKTIGDCFADNHYGVFARLAHKHNMIIHCEASGPHLGPFDGLKNLGRTDAPMGEFWVKSPHRPTEDSRFFMKCAGSAAHTYGKTIACGEGFTSIGPHWNDILWSSQKPTFDHEACAGLNLTYIHAFTCSPKEMGIPGQEYFAGTHFDPQLTWANQAGAFVGYLNRCQFLLQQGLFVADVCYYYGDQVPNVPGRKHSDPARVMPGYDYDHVSEEVLLTRMSVKNGRIVLPDGMSYSLMVLPNFKILSLPALKKIKELVDAGAKVAGPKPMRSSTLQNFPFCEEEFKRIADDLWDNGEISDKPAREVLASLKVSPDLETIGDTIPDFLHRRAGDSDIYFLSNPTSHPIQVTATFRINGKQPELWNPVNGDIRLLRQFRQSNGRTSVPLEFAAFGSAFVVFRHKGLATVDAQPNFFQPSTLQELTNPWTVKFDSVWGGPAKPVIFTKLEDWTKRSEEGIKYYSGTATYSTTFAFNKDKSQKDAQILLDLGLVKEIAEVRLNGKKIGVLWCPPWNMDITKALKNGENALEIDVVNLWPNRLIGDGKLPIEKRFAKTNVGAYYTKPLKGPDHVLLESGLLGPVRLIFQQLIK